MPDTPPDWRTALHRLNRSWGHAYVIFSGDRICSATRLGSGHALRAGCPDELGQKIELDSESDPVPEWAFEEILS